MASPSKHASDMNLVIRQATPEDSASLSHIALSAKKYWGYPDHWIELWTPQLTFKPEYFSNQDTWIADLDIRIAGFYTLQETNGNGWLENLWILPDFIEQGIGKRLFQDAVSRSRQMGHLILQLEADPNAVGFYEKMGMRRIGERRSEIEGQPRVLPIMEMSL
jgi:ribosomal protein S18 acetylase RimI-like enzyme